MSEQVLVEKLAGLGPEIAMGCGGCLCLLTGLWPVAAIRKLTRLVAALTLIVAGQCIDRSGEMSGNSAAIGPGLAVFVKWAIVLVGLLLLMVVSAVPGRWEEHQEPFEPSNSLQGEFFAFFLFSLTGAMLCAGANDLVWLFLALELTSLPTYVMVATSRNHVDAQEAAVKYFFLGAMAAAIFLYGFSLIYGAAGTTVLFNSDPTATTVASYISNLRANGSELPPLLVTGLLLSLIGIAFKIAAVPMHFYAADVYQGAATAVAAFLAFVPKVAGFVSMILLLSVVGWQLPPPIMWTLWVMAALTMTVGNVLGMLQTNVKRVLAYSSVAHSGYMLVGLVAGPSMRGGGETIGEGLAAVLFYLVAYGLATLGCFAALGSLRTSNTEAQTYDDLSGLATRCPWLTAILTLSVLSLIGLPPLVGFLGKIYLFGSAIEHGYVVLVVIAVLNTAVSAVYYLRIVGSCYFGSDQGRTQLAATPSRYVAALVAAIAVLALGFVGGWLVDAARESSAQANIFRVVESPATELAQDKEPGP